MEMLLRKFREQHLPVDGNVAQTVQRADLSVDATVAQTVQRTAFTSRWKCCSDSSESNIYQ
jgi:hypothetical protein